MPTIEVQASTNRRAKVKSGKGRQAKAGAAGRMQAYLPSVEAESLILAFTTPAARAAVLRNPLRSNAQARAAYAKSATVARAIPVRAASKEAYREIAESQDDTKLRGFLFYSLAVTNAGGEEQSVSRARTEDTVTRLQRAGENLLISLRFKSQVDYQLVKDYLTPLTRTVWLKKAADEANQQPQAQPQGNPETAPKRPKAGRPESAGELYSLSIRCNSREDRTYISAALDPAERSLVLLELAKENARI